ncbi:prolipoprotein signal peptidase [Candidatus Karelsulcia muelleri PSPU]|uniref:Lipoprotein signal peptidase n=1 Tax=Candidatus Karelsulcia muelleri PSPU TaxID=1189303 RepID=A0AAD1B1Z9_9FLAO|nr:prolipoprotein signal peptidase [Candidatus Karelsulcia muelleri PSPU]
MIKYYLITLNLIILDQFLKIYVKTHFKLGQSIKIFKWFKFFFIENPGIAYGFNLRFGYLEKIIISIIKTIIIVIFFYFFLKKNNKTSFFFKISICLLFAGSISNLLDCFFYGIFFNKGVFFKNNTWTGYEGISKFFLKKGYSFFMCGCVVDMLYFPFFKLIINKNYELIIFNIIFNIADICLSLGVIIFFLCSPGWIRTSDTLINSQVL